jgi:hypothetical protein
LVAGPQPYQCDGAYAGENGANEEHSVMTSLPVHAAATVSTFDTADARRVGYTEAKPRLSRLSGMPRQRGTRG